MDIQLLIDKYNQAVPRYTSYPTVPHWKLSNVDAADWKSSIVRNYEKERDNGISIYIHLPYCESLCTYCGCNKRITKNHAKESPYISAIIKEWQQYVRLLGGKIKVKNLHLGGGTPTFFSATNLKRMMEALLADMEVADNHSFSFEGHPNNTTYEHLAVLKEVGFNRVSYGVQDFDYAVQLAINRIQPYEQVAKVTEWSRSLGYKSINFDLVYGLPFQTLRAVEDTIRKVSQLKPNRIALYSYAHVPWKSKSQRGFDQNDLPSPAEKISMYGYAKSELEGIGYESIGMDHFALPEDELSIAKKSRLLNRNFMGYTTDTSSMMLGLGNSSISFSGDAFVQNEKQVEDYEGKIENNELALTKGHFLSAEEQQVGQLIKELICNEHVVLQTNYERELFGSAYESLAEMQDEGILNMTENSLTIKKGGMLFIRNVCALFDPKIKNQPKRQFSNAI